MVIRFGQDDAENEIQTKNALTLVLESEICAEGARVVKTRRQRQLIYLRADFQKERAGLAFSL